MMHSSYHLIFSSSTTTPISSSVSVLKIPWWWFRMDSYDKTLQGTVLLKLVTGQSDFKQNIFYRVTTFKSGRKLNIILEWRLFLSQLLDERFQANVRFPSTGWWRAQFLPRKGLRAVFPPLLVDCDEAQFLVYAVGASNCRATQSELDFEGPIRIKGKGP